MNIKNHHIGQIAWLSAIVLLVIILLASFAPEAYRLWGVDGLAYDNISIRILFIGIALLLSLLLVFLLKQANNKTNLIMTFIYLPVMVILGLLVFLTPAATLLRGDGQLLINNLTAGIPISLRSPLYAILTGLLLKIGSPFSLTPIGTYRIIDCLALILFILAITRFSRRFERFTTRVFVLVGCLFSASLPLMLGLVENYALLHALLAWSLVLSIEAIENNRFPWLGLVINLISCGIHAAAVTLLPAFLFTWGAKNQFRLRFFFFFLVAITGIITVVLIAPEHLLYPLGKKPVDGYTLISLRHLFDLVNLDFWAIPAVLFVGFIPLLFTCSTGVPPVIWTRRPCYNVKFKLDRIDYFLIAGMLGAYGFTLIFSPDLGMARDADLVALYALPAMFWVFYLWAPVEEKVTPLLVGAALFVGLITVGAQVWVQSREVTDVKRFIRQLEQNPKRSYYGWEVLAIHLRNKGRPAAEEKAYLKAINSPPVRNEDYVRYLIRLAQLANERGAPEETLNWCQKVIERAPNIALIYGMMGKALGDLGKENAALNAFRKAVELEPGTSILHANLGAYLLRINRLEDARKALLHGEEIATPICVQLLYTVGLVDEKLGMVLEAIRYYDRARTLDPQSQWGKLAGEAHRRLSLNPTGGK